MNNDLNRKDIERIEEAASNLRDKLLIRFFARLRCRVSESLSVAVTDINFARRTIVIAKTSLYYHRIVSVDRKTLRMLKAYIKRGGPVLKNGEMLIFGINRHRAWQIVHECAERAGLPKLENSESGKVHCISPGQLRGVFSPPKFQQVKE